MKMVSFVFYIQYSVTMVALVVGFVGHMTLLEHLDGEEPDTHKKI